MTPAPRRILIQHCCCRQQIPQRDGIIKRYICGVTTAGGFRSRGQSCQIFPSYSRLRARATAITRQSDNIADDPDRYRTRYCRWLNGSLHHAPLLYWIAEWRAPPFPAASGLYRLFELIHASIISYKQVGKIYRSLHRSSALISHSKIVFIIF